jgi:hypothetical protein
MKNTTLTNQVSLIMDKLDKFPLDMVEIGISQSLLSSKLTSMNQETIEKIFNSIIHITKNNLGENYDTIEVIAYRIDTEESDVFSMDYIQHRLILLGNGFIKKIPTLKENLNNFVSQKMGDTLSIDVRENQQSEEIYTYLMNQSPNSKRDEKYDNLSEKTNSFYHPDLYLFSEKGWYIFVPRDIE